MSTGLPGAWRSALVVTLSVVLAACGPPTRPLETAEPAVLPPTFATSLGRTIAPLAAEHPGRSGIYALDSGMEAFAVRVAMTRAAEHSLDVQYYIWRPDLTGTLLFAELRDAADRGVRVRLLLDDNNWRDIDPFLAELHQHPNIEVRLFNPFVLRGARVLNFATDFDRLNRRMHNKSFTADAQATIVGGRNIGDAYFDATDDIWFSDLDVLAVGPVVRDVAEDFERYWRSESAFPAHAVLSDSFAARGNITLDGRLEAVREQDLAQEYLEAVQDSKVYFDLRQEKMIFDWVDVEMVSDDPAKGLGQADPEAMLPQQLAEIIGEPEHDVELVSPYFVPTEAGVAAFANLAEQGVRIRILTNSLEATDISVVHAGYAKYRKPLLEAGIELFETRLQAAPGMRPAGVLGLGGSSSASSLHAKTFAVDGERVFVGSFNFDPRSVNFNTEMGFVIRSRALARKIDDAFDYAIPLQAYQLRLGEDGNLIWIKRDEDRVRYLTTEPGTPPWRRAWVRFLSVLPVEWML